MCIVSVIGFLVVEVLCSLTIPVEEITSKETKAWLSMDRRIVSPAFIHPSCSVEEAAGTVLFCLSENKVSAFNCGQGKHQWETALRQRRLANMIVADNVLWLGEDGLEDISRVDARKGSLLSPFIINRPEKRSEDRLLALAINMDSLFVLSVIDNVSTCEYSVSHYNTASNKLLWRKTIKADIKKGSPAWFWTARKANELRGIRAHMLSATGQFLYVCLGPTHGVFCLGRDDGIERWHTPYLASERTHGDNDGAIVSGPAVLRDGNGSVVAVLFVKVNDLDGYIKKRSIKCKVSVVSPFSGIEVDSIELPGCVTNDDFAYSESGVLWSCEDHGLVRLRVNESEPEGKLPFANERACSIDWYREFYCPRPRAWFKAGVAAQIWALSRNWVFMVDRGGYLVQEKDKVYRFPVSMVNSRTGTIRKLTLNVPFEGEFVLPRSPLVKIRLGVMDDAYVTSNPHLIWISRARVVGDCLCLSIQDSSKETELVFTLAALESFVTQGGD